MEEGKIYKRRNAVKGMDEMCFTDFFCVAMI